MYIKDAMCLLPLAKPKSKSKAKAKPQSKPQVKDAMCLLACSRHGLQIEELLELCSVSDPRKSETSPIEFAPVPV
jgi:hypothetical protein